MPFKSRAQIRKFGELVKQGQMSREEYHKWLAETVNIKRLPSRVKKKKKK